MGNVKVLNGALWGLNGLLGAGIVLFAWKFLLTPQASPFKDFRPEEDGPARQTAAVVAAADNLKSLRNPVEKIELSGPVAKAPTLFKAILKGALPAEKDPQRGVAFIKSQPPRSLELVAYMGEDILHEGKAYDEYRGWKLVELAKDRATFSNGAQKQELTIDQSVASVPGQPGFTPGASAGSGTSRAGQPYASHEFTSRLLASSEGRYVWGMDPNEVEWASMNVEKIMEQDFQVSPHPSGGLKIDSVSPGSMGSARGMVAGDVIKNVNGQPLASLADLKVLMNNPQMRRATGLSLTVERAGKPVVIEYRPLPAAPALPGQPQPPPPQR